MECRVPLEERPLPNNGGSAKKSDEFRRCIQEEDSMKAENLNENTNKDMRELTIDELEQVSGGDYSTTQEAAQILIGGLTMAAMENTKPLISVIKRATGN